MTMLDKVVEIMNELYGNRWIYETHLELVEIVDDGWVWKVKHNEEEGIIEIKDG